ncbi:F-box protein SKIP23-like [Apium graveolens]|uniref:F-box protein SKIP23-like n=1 Tax=Apium graveolens TaxID=4045 RepID=UPI003D79C051
MAVDWSELPPELLYTIATNLKHLQDHIRFRSVCQAWRSSTPETPVNLPCQLPWLMLPAHHFCFNPPSHHRGFYDLSNNKIHALSLSKITHRSRRCGSSHGWLAFLEESPSFFILNPLTRAVVNLPPLSQFPNVMSFDFSKVGREYTLKTGDDDDVYSCNLKEMRDSYIKKVILSRSPHSGSDYIVVALINQTGDLAYCKKHDLSWKFIEAAHGYCEDVVYYNGMFMAVNKYGEIAACDLNGDKPNVSFMNTPHIVGGDMQYLVACKDELLLVTRYLELEFNGESSQLDIIYKTTEFQVSRLNFKGVNWEALNSLGDMALFLGENSSLAMSASEFPECKGNRIYFTDDYSEWNYDGVNGDHDLGVYNLDDGSIEALPCYPFNSYSTRSWPPPIWVTPNPC